MHSGGSLSPPVFATDRSKAVFGVILTLCHLE